MSKGRADGRKVLLAGPLAALAALGADQLFKAWQIAFFAARGDQPVEVVPFFNFVMVWNRGVSFGAFAQGGDGGRWLLIAVTAAITVAVTVFMLQSRRRWSAMGYGLIAGGAMGNIVDRLLRGAVADGFDFHVGNWHWPAFNLADTSIFIGAALLIIISLFPAADKHK